jgi:hypothetical protein
LPSGIVFTGIYLLFLGGAMSYYHDDPIEPELPRRRNLFGIAGLIVSLICGGLYIQTTLAANVSLNSGAPIEFGQGFTQTVACSGSTALTITPTSSFVNSSGGGGHYLASFTVSNIPAGCQGDDLTISAYGNTSNTPLALFNTTSTDAVVYNNSGTFQMGLGGSGATISSGSGTFTVTFTAPVATSASVFKLTIQSGAHTRTCAEGGTCKLGETGSGGGVVFILNSASGGTGGAYNYEAWTSDLSASVMNWNNVNGVLGVGQAIGDGYTNRGLFTGGAGLGCKNATYSSLSDWFLPSRNELEALRNYWGSTSKTSPPNMKDTGYGYWSSSENGANNAVAIRWNDGMLYGDGYAGKTSPSNTGWARCVRRF